MSTPALTGDPTGNSDDATDLLTWITLSRVADGSLTQTAASPSRAIATSMEAHPCHPILVVPITTLLTEGLLAVSDADPAGGQQLAITESGRTRHEQLRRRGAGGISRDDGRG
ncbi:MAG: hypothetical protein ACRDRX_11855 [Pseudonocardiaceae bacterium]